MHPVPHQIYWELELILDKSSFGTALKIEKLLLTEVIVGELGLFLGIPIIFWLVDQGIKIFL